MRAAFEELASLGTVAARSPVVASEPLGPSRRSFANAAVLLDSDLTPETLLRALQQIEREFGRRRARRWGERVLDLDIVLWSGGALETADLTIPHPEFRSRPFVLAPAAAIAPDWRDPATGLSVRQLNARLTRPRALPR